MISPFYLWDSQYCKNIEKNRINKNTSNYSEDFCNTLTKNVSTCLFKIYYTCIIYKFILFVCNYFKWHQTTKCNYILSLPFEEFKDRLFIEDKHSWQNMIKVPQWRLNLLVTAKIFDNILNVFYWIGTNLTMHLTYEDYRAKLDTDHLMVTRPMSALNESTPQPVILLFNSFSLKVDFLVLLYLGTLKWL